MTNDTLYNFESDLLAELRSIDQSAAHARAHRRHAARVIVPWAALGGALATAGAVTLTVLGGSSGSFPGWTATAGAATVPEVTNASVVCGLDPSNVILSQVRGAYTVVMAESGGVTTVCLADTQQLAIVTTEQLPAGATKMTMNGDSSGGLDAWSSNTLGDQADGAVSVTGHMTVASEGPLTVVDGQAPAGATAMTIIRSDGTTVEATVESGEFFAWWPGSTNAVSATVTTPSGTANEPFVTAPSAG